MGQQGSAADSTHHGQIARRRVRTEPRARLMGLSFLINNSLFLSLSLSPALIPTCQVLFLHPRKGSSIDMSNNDVGKESAQKFMKQTGALRTPPFILLHKLQRHILPPYRHRYYTYRFAIPPPTKPPSKKIPPSKAFKYYYVFITIFNSKKNYLGTIPVSTSIVTWSL